MINYNIPGCYEHAKLNLAFIDYFKEYPERFIENVNIESCFGNFQYCIFDGGRIFTTTEQCGKEQVEKIVSMFNNRNIPIRLVFTNKKLQPYHYYDEFSNMVLEVCNVSRINEIVISDDNLMKYIQDKYSNFKFISSTTKCLNTFEDTIKELEDPNYSLVCLNYNFNKDLENLKKLPKELKDKCEFLINAICPSNCNNRKMHYDLNSDSMLNMGRPYAPFGCEINYATSHPINWSYKNNFSLNEIQQYHDLGFSHFKIEGRTLEDYEVLSNYLRFMIKPEWQYETIHAIHVMESDYE